MLQSRYLIDSRVIGSYRRNFGRERRGRENQRGWSIQVLGLALEDLLFVVKLMGDVAVVHKLAL